VGDYSYTNLSYPPPKHYHSASFCRLSLSPNPNEIEMAAKTTSKEAIFVTDASVNLCSLPKENVPFITLRKNNF